jgi:hypothetical protein
MLTTSGFQRSCAHCHSLGHTARAFQRAAQKKEKLAREVLQSALPVRAKTLWIPPSLMEPQGCSVIAALALAKRLFLKLKTCFRKVK